MDRKQFLKLGLSGTVLAFTPKPIYSFHKDSMPKILILGDSISIGYTPFVQEMLKDKAIVNRPMKGDGKPENCQGTTFGVESIDRWIGDTKWDLIHFNFGLHDLKRVDPETGANIMNKDHPHQADLKQYKKNLDEIVAKLVKTGAKLIFATTTPYPDVVEGPVRDPGLPVKYNKQALKIMKKNNIPINDLHAFVLPKMAELQLPKNVHFTKPGSEALARQVVKAMINQLLFDK